MKKNTHDITEPIEKQTYKKKYLVRKFQEIEAEQEIKEYYNEDCEAGSGVVGQHGVGPDGVQRGTSKLS
jgi:hypothetical protein